MLLDVGFTSCISLLLKHAGASLSGDALVAKKNYIYKKEDTLHTRRISDFFHFCL